MSKVILRTRVDLLPSHDGKDDIFRGKLALFFLSLLIRGSVLIAAERRRCAAFNAFACLE